MPTLTLSHEAPLELIRQHPGLALELVRAMTDVPLPSQVSVSFAPTDMSQVVPVQFLADSVVVITDEVSGEPVLAIVVESQGRDDPTKQFSWPIYVTVVRKVANCKRAILLVVCPDPDEAAKCRRVINTGHPGFDLWPIVIDPLNTPDLAGASPYLVIFLATMHAIDIETEPGTRQVLTAIRDAAAAVADRKTLIAIILKTASDAARTLLETMMTTTEWKDAFVEGFVNEGIRKGMLEGIEQGIQQGKEQGIQQGKEQGIQEGIAKGRAEDVLKILDARHIELTPRRRGEVAACTDLALLGLWFDRALAATTVGDVFSD
jgi:hypothetical protein